MNDPLILRWQEAEAYLRNQRMPQARRIFEHLATHPSWVAPARLRLTRIALAHGHLRDAVAHIIAATQANENDPSVIEAICAALCQLGEIELALDMIHSQVVAACDDAHVLAGIAKQLCDQSLPDHALPLLHRARALGLDDAPLHYLTGLCLLYLGDLEAADNAFETCLQRAPLHAACHRQIARIRRASSQQNHVARLQSALSQLGRDHPDAPPLYFALFKELDDLGDTTAAWSALDAGMRARRRQVQYDSAAEANLFKRLRQVRPGTAGEGHGEDGGATPIFIIGQPRSGTTLLERLLTASSAVADGGELRDFAFQLRWLCDIPLSALVDVPLIEKFLAQSPDIALLGQRYLSHTRWRAAGKPFYTDKLPANFALAGMIARALPQARLLHMRRSPMDTCFSNLKELFADAYPHSYDQIEMATHYRHYRDLMTHWHSAFPGRILDIHYEKLVSAPDTCMREILAFCGISAPAETIHPPIQGSIATASSVQLREPVHTRYVDGWCRYADRLAPMMDALPGTLLEQ